MNIPTTKEELDLLLAHIHDECSNDECDLMKLADVVETLPAIAQFHSGSHRMLQVIDNKYYIAMLICTGIKIGYLIQHPELLVVKDESEKVQ